MCEASQVLQLLFENSLVNSIRTSGREEVVGFPTNLLF